MDRRSIDGNFDNLLFEMNCLSHFSCKNVKHFLFQQALKALHKQGFVYVFIILESFELLWWCYILFCHSDAGCISGRYRAIYIIYLFDIVQLSLLDKADDMMLNCLSDIVQVDDFIGAIGD